MQKPLTDILVRSLAAPPTGRTELGDARCAGLVIDAAAEKRDAGLDALDEAKMAEADAETAAAGRAVEIAERAISASPPLTPSGLRSRSVICFMPMPRP